MHNRGEGLALHAVFTHPTNVVALVPSSSQQPMHVTACYAIISIGRQQPASATNRVLGQNTIRKNIDV